MKDPIRVTTFTKIWGGIRRSLSRTEWAVWLLGLSRVHQQPTERGLILIQIDGLSKSQLKRALVDERMPFLKSLITKENYIDRTLYSGLPSSTPGVQGELYYGVRTVVPAFGFRDHRSGRLVRMFASETAQEVENKLAGTGEGLLQGGSSYCNIYSGGADDVYFCATSFGWSEFFRTVNPFQMAFLLLLNFVMFFRIAGLMIVEFFVATFDFIRGLLSGREFWQELIMIPARMVVVVLLRELVTIGTCFDAARGQPIIHLNLLGYDEQAHRRGPGSRFAHWTLGGIDNSIQRIWKAAHRGAGREYDVWIFSDHGQEATGPYSLALGKPIQQVVAEVVDGAPGEPVRSLPSNRKSKTKTRMPSRANWLGIGWLVSMLFGEQDHDIQSRSPNVQTVTSGPLGFVYFMNEANRVRRHEIAKQLVQEFHVPMTVLALRSIGEATGAGSTDDGDIARALVITREGTFTLPQDAVQVFGPEHPFLDDVAHDMVQLAQHPDAGDIVLVGWTNEGRSTSFVLQHGAHAGPGTGETRAFALLPADVSIGDPHKRYLRPNDLRLAALRFLDRDEPRQVDIAAAPSKPPGEGTPIRLLTWNVHACVGMDGQLSPERIARVIAQSEAKIICLQELDVFRRRSGNRDQAHAIAKCLAMRHEFHHAWHLEGERFGNSVLACYPMRVVEAKGLHHHHADRSRRSALWVEIEMDDGVLLQVINTHLSIYPKEQLIQARQLIEEWVKPASLQGPVILCGDFNARPGSKTWSAIAAGLQDVESFDRKLTRATYFSPFPFTRVDHIFLSRGLVSKSTQVVETRLARVASDHLPLLADVTTG